MSHYEILLRKIEYITKDEWNIMIEEMKQSMNEFYSHLLEEELCGYNTDETEFETEFYNNPNNYIYQYDTQFINHKTHKNICIIICLMYQQPNKFVSISINYKIRQTYRDTYWYDTYNHIKRIPKICLSNPRAGDDVLRALKNAYDSM